MHSVMHSALVVRLCILAFATSYIAEGVTTEHSGYYLYHDICHFCG